MIKGKVIVIDDEVHAAAALETLLREDGYEVSSAHDARDGLALLEKTDADVVLTDRASEILRVSPARSSTR